MKTLLDAQAAGRPRACDLNTLSLGGGSSVQGSLATVTADRGGALAAGPVAYRSLPFAAPQAVRKQHQNMTRIAATGGDPGSHPEWDPV